MVIFTPAISSPEAVIIFPAIVLELFFDLSELPAKVRNPVSKKMNIRRLCFNTTNILFVVV